MAHRRGASSRLSTLLLAGVLSFGMIFSGGSAAFASGVEVEPSPTATSQPDPTQEPSATLAPEAPEPTPETSPATPSPGESQTAPAEPEQTPTSPEPMPTTDPVRQVVEQSLDAVGSPTAATFFWSGEQRAISSAPGASGVVTVTGTLVDGATGTPLASFPVAATGDGEGGQNRLASTLTADDGTFSLVVNDAPQYFRVYLESDTSRLYVTASGDLGGTTAGFAYDLGALSLAIGAELTGTVTLPTSPGAFPVSIEAVPAAAEYGYSSYATAAGGSQVPWRIVVAPGDYQVRFSDGSAFLEQWWASADQRSESTVVSLAAGERKSNIDATLSFGRNSISGRVVNESGQPLSGVSVGANSTGNAFRWYSATTDSDGRYVFGNVAAGSYRVQFTPQRGDGLGTFYGGSTYDSAQIIAIPSSQPTALTGIDVTIVAGATVRGVLPPEAARLVTTVALQEENRLSTVGWASVARDGSFEMVDVPAGTYRLQLTAGTFRELWGEPIALTAGQSLELDLSDYVLEIGAVSVVLDMGPSVSGTVELLDAQTRQSVASAGTYTTPILLSARPGDYLVRLTDWSSGGTQTYYGGGSSPSKATVVTIVADATLPIIISSGTASIDGTVTDIASGAALADIIVRLFRADSTGAFSQPVAQTVTDAAGSYTFEGLAENNYAVQMVGDNQLFVNRWFGPSGRQDDATAITLGDGEAYASADVALTLGGGISGVIAEAGSFSPGDLVYLSLRTPDYSDSLTFTGSVATLLVDGAFTLRGLPAGEWVLSGSIDGIGLSPTDLITVVAGEITDGAVLRLPAAQIVGTVRAAATGLPVGAYVTAEWTVKEGEYSWRNQATVSADFQTGVYRLSGIPAGAEVILKFSRNWSAQNVSSQWWQGAASEAEATPIVIGPEGSEPFVADADLEPGVVVTGRFIDAITGEPAAGVPFDGGSSGADGRFTVSFDRLGAMNLQTYANDSYVASTTALTVPPEGLVGVEIPLQRGYTISGTVAAANNGVPLTNISVRVSSADDEWDGYYSVGTQSDGSFRIPAREPGRYKLQFENYNGLYVTQWFDGAVDFADAQIVELVDRGVDSLDVRMTLGGTVSGRIVDPSGQPIAGATVGVATAPETGIARLFSDVITFFSGGGDTSPILDIETTTDSNGRFRLPSLPPGDYTLYVYTPERGTTWFNGKSNRAEADVIRISQGQTQSLDGEVVLPELQEGEVPRTPEQSLSDSFEIVTHPAPQAVGDGATATFLALASGLPVPTVQWQRQSAGAQEWTNIDGATQTRLSVTAALGDDGSSFRAVFAQGDRQLQTDAAVLRVSAAPTAPIEPTAPVVTEVATDGAKVTWTAPPDGGQPITGYELSLYPAGESTPVRTISLGAVTSTTIGLEAGTSYEITVAAKNGVGTGAASSRTAFETPDLQVPGSPASVSAESTSATTISVSWEPPTADGGSPITGYRVSATHGSDSVTVAAGASTTGISISGLTSDTDYTVEIVAINAVGQGAPISTSVRTDALPPAATVPAPPSGLRLVRATPQVLEVAWNAPESDGGAELTGYTVTVSQGTAVVATRVVGPEVWSTSIDGLQPQTLYSITVVASNQVGASATSATLEALTEAPPIFVPGSPRQVNAAATSTSAAQVSWTAPESDGGAPITGYDVFVTRDGESAAAVITISGTQALLSGLLPETTYAVTVAARNRLGAGTPSAAVPVTTPAVAPVVTVPDQPGTPRLVAATADSISLVWDAPVSDGGSPVISYRVKVFGGGQQGSPVDAASTSVRVNGLRAATSYTFTVQAINALGASAESAVSASVSTTEDLDNGGGGHPPTEEPGTSEPVPPTSADLTEKNRGGLTVGPGSVTPGGQLRLEGLLAGATYDVWFFSEPVPAGTVTADRAGAAIVTVPLALSAGAHRVAVTDPETGVVVGWAPITVSALPATGSDAPIGALGASVLLLGSGLLMVIVARTRRARRG